MLLLVEYQDHHCGYVNDQALDKLVAIKGVRRFYRPTEEQWVDVYRDPIRGLGGDYYGPDRRQVRETTKR